MTGALFLMIYIGGGLAAEEAGWGFWRLTFWPVHVVRILVRRIIEKDAT